MKTRWIVLISALILVFGLIPFVNSRPPFKYLFLKLVSAKVETNVYAEEMDLSWFGPQKFKKITLSSPDLEGTIDSLSSPVPFWKLGALKSSFTLEGGFFKIHPEGKPSAEVEQVNAKVIGSKIETTGVTKEGNLAGEFAISGKAAQSEFDLTIKATRMPTLFVDRMFDLDGFLVTTLGSTFDCTATGTLQDTKGDIDLHLTATNAAISLNCAFTEERVVLKKPLLATFQLTPQLSERLLKNVNPLFLTGAQSKSPIVLRIDPKNFSFPRPFDLAKLSIAQGMLDMGQVKINNGKSLRSLVKLLKSENLSNLKQMTAWFTPLTFSLQDGLLKTSRMDLLLDSVHLCTWGDIHLSRNQIDMTLGIPADTLSSAFGIQNLPSSYVLQIPIRGPTQDPEIVTGPATAKIAATLAAQNLPKKGGALGSILNLFTPALLDDPSEVPPPNRPFPWEKR